MNGDTGLAYDIVASQMAEGVDLGTILFDVLAPMHRDVGRRWQTGDYRVADEHATTASVETIVSLLGGSLEAATTGRRFAIVAAEGDIHSLPARIVATYLVYLGYNVMNLGASIPAADLGAYVTEQEVDVLLLTATATASLRGARSNVAAAHAADVPVIVGGRAFGNDDRRALALGADGWVADPRQLPSYLETWEADIATSEAAVVETPPVALRLPQLVEDLAARVPGLGRPEAGRIVAVIDAAELTADVRVLSELFEWYRLHAGSPDNEVDEQSLLVGLLAVVPSDDPLWTRLASMDSD